MSRWYDHSGQSCKFEPTMSCVPLSNYHATPHYSDHAASSDAIRRVDRRANPAKTKKVSGLDRSLDNGVGAVVPFVDDPSTYVK